MNTITSIDETVDHKTLTKMAAAGTITHVNIVGQVGGGWGLVVKCGNAPHTLAVARGDIRIFKKLETLVTYVRSLGIPSLQLDFAQLNTEAGKPRKREDVTERLKAAHQAATYNAWLKQQVQESIDDPRPSLSHEQVKADWSTRRAELLKQAQAEG